MGASGSTITVGSNSNAYGTRYVQSSEPTSPCDGDIWYDTSGFSVSGSIIQVVNSTTTTETNVSSTSFVATSLSCAIIPSSTSSRILIIVHGTVNTPGGSGSHSIPTLYVNNTTNLGDATFGMGDSASLAGGGLSFESFYSINYLHSPGTTSSTTYTVYGRVYASGVSTFNLSGRISHMTLMEVVG
jgi:hypothetical protein